jgi:hypothetical protein
MRVACAADFRQYVAMTSHRERLEALGRVVETAAMMDQELILAFVALLGTEYAAVVAAGQQTGWLIDYCGVLAKARKDISEEGKKRIAEALNKCKEGSIMRNQLVHGAWATGGGESVNLRSKRRSHLIGYESWTVEQIEKVAKNLFDAYRGLGEAIVAELGAASMSLGWKLRQADQVGPPADLSLNY